MTDYQKWKPPTKYKSVKDAQSDYGEAIGKIAEGISMLRGIAKALNETMPGRGDIIYGIAARFADTALEIRSVKKDISAAISKGESPRNFKARKLLHEAARKTPDSAERRNIKQRIRNKP